MKVLILVLALFALAYCDDDEVVQSGTVDDPSQLEPGYVLQPDGSYLKTIESPGEQEEIPEGYVLQPDGTYLKTIEEPGQVEDEDEDEYSPQFSNNILTVDNGENKCYFKVSQGDPSNENDYSVVPVKSADDPTPLNSKDKDDPQVYLEGTQGKPDYNNVLGVGKGPNRLYLKMKPDSSKPSGFRFVPQYISGYTRVPGDIKENAAEPAEEEEEEEDDDNTDIVKKQGYSVIIIGRPDCRRYVKLIPSKNNNPYDFDLKPIKHPDQPDSSPDADDDDAPEIIENGKRGTPDYQPVIASGPSSNRRYIAVAVDPKQPKRFNLVPAHYQPDPAEKTTEPNEVEIEYEDIPENPQYTTVTVPGNKIPVEIVSVGHPAHRVHFKIVRRSNRPGDWEVTTIRDPAHHDSPADLRNEYAPEVCQQGDPSDVNNAPIVATGPRFKRRYYKLLIIKKRLRLIPVRRQRIKGTQKYRYMLKKRRWHYRHRVVKVRHVKSKRNFVKRIIRTRTQRQHHHGGRFLGGLHFGGRRQQAHLAQHRGIQHKSKGIITHKTIGHRNIGHRNVGIKTVVHRNVGHRNVGHRNVGHRNVGLKTVVHNTVNRGVGKSRGRFLRG